MNFKTKKIMENKVIKTFTYVFERWGEYEMSVGVEDITAEIDQHVYADDNLLSDALRDEDFIQKHNKSIDPETVMYVFEVLREL